MRLRSDFVVAAYLRRCAVENAPAVLRRRGAAEAGAIAVKIDRLDGTATLYLPAAQSAFEAGEGARLWTRAHAAEVMDAGDVETRLRKEVAFDTDLWIVEVEDRAGRSFLDLAE